MKVIEGELRKFPYTLPRGVFLVHLKYANLSANAANDIVRMQVATPTSDRDEGLPGDGWRYAVEDTQKFLSRHQGCDQVSWLEAENEAYSVLSKSPRRVRRINFIKAASTKFHTRTTLPDWLSDTLP